MFGIGFSELVLIGLVLIIFIKPEDLPKFFRSAGKLYGQLKRAYDDVVSAKDKILKEIDDAVRVEETAAEKHTAPLPQKAPGPDGNAAPDGADAAPEHKDKAAETEAPQK
jgi:sec-independent protein translocase protein TatB